MFTELSKIALFSGLKLDEITNLMEQVHYQIHNYEADDVIAYFGTSCDRLHLMVLGSVRAEMNSLSKSDMVVRDIYAPDSFAEAYLFANNNRFKTDIVANEATKLILIYKSDFVKMMNKNQQIMTNYMAIISNRFVAVLQKVNFLTIKTVEGKLAKYLLAFAQEKKTNRFKIGKTQEELAVLFGITRPALSRNLGKLKKEGILSFKGKEVEILDAKALKLLM